MPDPLAEAERRDDLRRLVADVRNLPEQQRSALLMRELEGLSYAELADALDVTVPAVKSLLVRARMGLVEAAEARDTACSEIRSDLTLSFGRGVRASAKARRHMRECSGCRDYRSDLRGVRAGLSALTPTGHSAGLLAKLVGLGGAGGGAAASGGAAAGGGAVAVGGGAVAATTAKVAAIVCCAAITAGGAQEIKERTSSPQRDAGAAATKALPATPAHRATPTPDPRPMAVQPDRTAGAGARARQAAATGTTVTPAERRRAIQRRRAAAAEEPMSPHAADDVAPAAAATAPPTGGAAAPTDDPAATGSPSASTETGYTPPLVAGTQPEGGATATTASDGSGSSSGSTSSGSSSGTQSQSGPTATVATAPSGGR